ncbi:flagellar hook-basal body complex protein FliE [Sphingomonas sp.]|uniref:flagellar hook-basal body complex protein FliE n=1 Tax=Sphingomonas sp. TaxID=28214 RepID=UPI002C5DA9C0|nr:flagellar hook-basal body complex protein FliE [Sphingomonas sp.]HWK36606.1 flagellar hook-basal body complex protein FliE [Sphingomonas sp.]
MSGVGGVGGAMGVDRVMELRAQILERNAALSRANAAASAPAGGAAPAGPASFTDTFTDALKSVNESQSKAGALSAAYERGETIDIAKVMLARQEASVGFEATLQVRNKLLAAYKDIMSMPV